MIDPIKIYFIPSKLTLKLFLVINSTGIINMLDSKNLQNAKIEEEQYWDRIFPLVQDSPHVAIVTDNKIYKRVWGCLFKIVYKIL